MPSYKLIYFDFRGKGEVIRLLFAHAGVDYIDERLAYGGEQWLALKKGMPYKQLPVLEVDGKRLFQSNAILRFLAKEFGLAGKTPFKVAKAEEFCEAIRDIINALPENWWTKTGKDLTELVKPAMTEVIPPMLANIQSNMSSEYFLEEMTYAEIYFIYATDFLLQFSPSVLDGTPKLKALDNKVRSIPNIAKYLKKRPVRPY